MEILYQKVKQKKLSWLYELTFSQASEMVFWNRIADFMTSKTKATLSWPLLHDGTLEDLSSDNKIKNKTSRTRYIYNFLFVFQGIKTVILVWEGQMRVSKWNKKSRKNSYPDMALLFIRLWEACNTAGKTHCSNSSFLRRSHTTWGAWKDMSITTALQEIHLKLSTRIKTFLWTKHKLKVIHKGQFRGLTSLASDAEMECKMNLTITGRSSNCTAERVPITTSRTW